VTIACAEKYVAEFKNWFTCGIKERKDRLAKRSTLLLIVALSLELICLVRTNILSGMLIGSLSEKAEEADRKAKTALGNSATALTQSRTAEDSSSRALDESSKATTSASNALALARGARQEADSFERDIAAAKKQATESALELARLKAPRIIKPGDQQPMCRALAAFAGTKFDMYVALDQEAINLAGTIKSILACAKWVQVPAKEVIQLSGTNPRIGLTSVSGVMLEIDETRTKDWKSILEAATLIFRSAGIDTKANVGSTGSEPLAIHIFVGSKPQ